jgi:acyl carrier protein
MNIEADIKQYIASELLAEDQPSNLGNDDALISSGRVDSMGLLQILSFIQQRFGVDLMAVGTPHDFDTVAALAAAVRRNKRDA